MAKKKTRVLLPGGIQGLVHDLQSGKPTNMKTVEPENNDSTLDDEKNAAKNDVAAQEKQHLDNQINNDSQAQNGQTAAQQPQQSAQPSEYQQNNIGQQSASEPFANPAENRAQSYNPASPSENANGGAAVSGGYTQSQGATSSSQPQGASSSQPQGSASTLSEGAGASGRQNGPTGSVKLNLGSRSYSPGRPPKQNTMKEYHIVKDDSKDSWQLFLDMAKQYKDGGGKLATIYIDSSLKNVLDRLKYAGSEKLSTSAILSSIVARFIYDHEEDIKKVLYSGDIL